MLQSGHGGVDRALNLLRHGGGHALGVPLVGVQALRLHEDGVALLVLEAHHLVLDGGAVARAGAVDGAGVHGRAVQVVQDDPVGLRGGVGQVAARLVRKARRIGEEGEGHDGLVAVLRLHFGKIDGASVDARGGAGLEAADGEAQIHQVLRQRVCRQQALGAAVPAALANDDAGLQVHARAHDGGAAADLRACGGLHTRHAAVLHENLLDLRLAQVELFAIIHRTAHALLVFLLVGLGAQRVHRRTLAGVEHAALDEHVVDGAAHLAAQRVQLPHQMALRRAADGGIAGHHRQRIQVQRDQQRAVAHARAGQRGLAARVPRADDHRVVSFVVLHRAHPHS